MHIVIFLQLQEASQVCIFQHIRLALAMSVGEATCGIFMCGIAALMGGKGTVWAFDRDAKRLDRLKANAAATGAVNIQAQQARALMLLYVLPH